MTQTPQVKNDYSRFKGWTQDSFGLYKRHWAAYYQLEIRRCVRRTGGAQRTPLKLLEIGFGNGAFMGWANAQGHEVHGIEIEALQLDAARLAGFTVAESLAELAAQGGLARYDGVVAFDVFEHLNPSQLQQMVKDLHSVLNPGGWILARFPNGDSPFGRLNQHGDLTHVTALGSMAVRQFAKGAGLQVLSVGSQPVALRGVGPLRALVHVLSLAVRCLLEAPIQLLLNAYYPGALRWFPLTPNLVAYLHKPPTEPSHDLHTNGRRPR